MPVTLLSRAHRARDTSTIVVPLCVPPYIENVIGSNVMRTPSVLIGASTFWRRRVSTDKSGARRDPVPERRDLIRSIRMDNETEAGFGSVTNSGGSVAASPSTAARS